MDKKERNELIILTQYFLDKSGPDRNTRVPYNKYEKSFEIRKRVDYLLDINVITLEPGTKNYLMTYNTEFFIKSGGYTKDELGLIKQYFYLKWGFRTTLVILIITLLTLYLSYYKIINGYIRGIFSK